MPGRWVIRRDADGNPEGEAMHCFLPHAIVAEPGLRTVEQCVSLLIQEGETCAGDGDKRPILKAGVFAGYIQITREAPL